MQSADAATSCADTDLATASYTATDSQAAAAQGSPKRAFMQLLSAREINEDGATAAAAKTSKESQGGTELGVDGLPGLQTGPLPPIAEVVGTSDDSFVGIINALRRQDFASIPRCPLIAQLLHKRCLCFTDGALESFDTQCISLCCCESHYRVMVESRVVYLLNGLVQSICMYHMLLLRLFSFAAGRSSKCWHG